MPNLSQPNQGTLPKSPCILNSHNLTLFPIVNVLYNCILILFTQLFDYCLAPDTTGDGTGCDNMTAVIVKFKKEGGSGVEATKVNGKTSEAAEEKKQTEETEQQQSSKRKESEGEDDADGEKASEGDPPSKKPKL